jgi:hypothetical protein
MTKKEKSEWRNWWRFCGRRLREFIFLGIWAAMAWALDVYIVHPFPVSGPPKVMLFVLAGLFDLSTLLELVLLLFWPYKASLPRWFGQKPE